MMHRTFPSRRSQRGAALLIMVVIMVLGIAAVLVGSLNSSAINVSRQQQTSAALAQAKEALIGYAASDSNRPGELPCPDVDGDGKLTIGVDFSTGSPPVCTSFVGYLPWKTLDLAELRDGDNEKLWYALSQNFYAGNTVTLNSDSTGQLLVSGTQSINNIAAIIISPGAPLSGQKRSTSNLAACTTTGNTVITENQCAVNYLEGNNGNPSPNTSYQAGATSSTFNDQILTLNAIQIMQPVEMRIAREAKACLDNYAASNSNKYPWAVDPTDVTFYYSKSNTLFGRLPKHRVPDSDVQNFLNALNAFQLAVTNCVNNTGSQSVLRSTGSTLENASDQVRSSQPTTPAISSAVTSPAKSAGDKAKDANVTCNDIRNNPVGNGIQTNLNSTLAALSSLPPSFNWPTSCTLFSSNYWAVWRNLIYYQLDQNFSPSGGSPLPITINGTGSYRAAVIAARSPIGTQVRNPSVANTYLEGANVHNNPSNAFVTNSISNTNFQTVNDLVLCLDARVNCK